MGMEVSENPCWLGRDRIDEDQAQFLRHTKEKGFAVGVTQER